MRYLSTEDILTDVKNVASKKVCISSYILVGTIKNFTNCYCEQLKDVFDKCLVENEPLDLMKKEEISSIFKKLEKRNNYGPISSLSNLTKIF